MPIKVLNTKYNIYTFIERVYNVVDVAETIILGTMKEGVGRILPNPFTNHFKIELSNNFGNKAEIKLFDLHGKNIIPVQKVSDEELIDLSYLSPGTYILHLSSLDHSKIEFLRITKIP